MFKIAKMKNGLALVIAPVKGTKTMTVLVTIGTGAKYEDKRTNGLSHFLEHMFFKGTKKRPTPLAVAGDADSIGGEFNAFTSKESTSYYMKVDATKAEKAIEIISDLLNGSLFNAEEMEREKGVIIEEINMYNDNPMMHIEDVFEDLVFGDTPAGWPTQGFRETVSKFTRQDFLDYVSAQYKIENTIVLLAGDINKTTVALAEKYFAGYAKNHQRLAFNEKPAVKINQSKPALKVEYKKTDQSHLILGVHGFPYGHKNQAIMKVMSILLGGSMSSRLWMEIREKRGLAYYVRTSADSYTDCGYLTTQAGVQNEKIEDAIKTILIEYKKLTAELVKPKELQRVKDMVRGKISLQLEASDDVANWYSRQAIMNLTQARIGVKTEKIQTPEEFFKALDKVTAADIRRVAREIFVEKNLNLAIVGPFDNDKRFQKLLKF